MGFLPGLLGIGGSGGNFQAVAPGQEGLAQAQQPVQQNLQGQQAFVNAVAPGGGQGLAVQNQLSQQLMQQAQGQGPNPALAQLAQTTGQNVANQAALQAGQRGASQNVGLMARQIGQQGAATQQQATGQAAIQSAQQQLAAQQQLQQLAGQQVGQQAGALGQQAQTALGNQGQVYGLQSGANAANAGVQSQVAKGQQGLLGGALGGIGSAIGLADGGMVPTTRQAGAGMYAEGGQVGPASYVGKFLKQPPQMLAKGGKSDKVDVMLSPGEKVLSPGKAKEVAKGKASPMEGKTVPGKAKVKGDSLKNDVVPDKLSEGSVVLPRHVMQSEDPAANAHKFVSAIMAKKTLKR